LDQGTSAGRRDGPGPADAARPGAPDGTSSGIVFKCTDVQGTHAELRKRGVAFSQEPVDQPGGFMGVFADPDGNTYVLRG
jgi:predicted enzyme related to lactoylglutathione lyase